MVHIDWQFTDKVVEASNTPSKSRQNDEMFTFQAEEFEDAVVMPSYRNIDQPQYFYVAEIRSDLNPVSPFPSPELYKTFKDYYSAKYGLKITNPDQPLLDVDHTSARLNLLIPRYMNQKGVPLPTSSAETKKARRENLQQKQILVPELCDIHVFPASLWRKAVCLPAILYRMNYLLLGEEIRKHIATETKIGIADLPDDYRFPKLDFGIDTSPEHLKMVAENMQNTGQATDDVGMGDAEKETEIVKSRKPEDEVFAQNEEKTTEEIVCSTEKTDSSTCIWRNTLDKPDILPCSEPVKKLARNFDEKCSLECPIDRSVVDQEKQRSQTKDSKCNNCYKSAISIARNNCDNINGTADKVDTFQGGEENTTLNSKCDNTENLSKINNDEKESVIVGENQMMHKMQNGFIDAENDTEVDLMDKCLNLSLKNKVLKSACNLNGVKTGQNIDENTESEKTLKGSSKVSESDDTEDVFTNVGKFVSEKKKSETDGDVCPEPLISLDEDMDLQSFIGPSPCEILQALTMSNANDFFSLERLETIGDSFLKYAITVYLYCSYPGIHEGKLSYLRSKQVSNYNLYRLGKRKGLAECMISNKFEPYENWLPPGYVINEDKRKGPVPKVFVIPVSIHKSSSTVFTSQKSLDKQDNSFDDDSDKKGRDKDLDPEMKKFQTELEEIDQIARAKDEEYLKEERNETQQSYIPYSLQLHHCLPDKSIADCMEALIGCYLTSCDKMAALRLMSWMGLKVLPEKKYEEDVKVNILHLTYTSYYMCYY